MPPTLWDFFTAALASTQVHMACLQKDLSEQAKNVKIGVTQANAHPTMTSAEDFNDAGVR